MSNENNNLHNEETEERIDSESISDIINNGETDKEACAQCESVSDAESTDAIGEEQDCDTLTDALAEGPHNKKAKRKSGISVKAYLFSTVAVVLATLLLTYSICAEVFRAKYADNLIVQEQEASAPKTGIDLLNEYIDQYLYGDYDKNEMMAMALKAYVLATGDPYARYYTLEEIIELNEADTSMMCGIGVNIAYEIIDYNGEDTPVVHIFNVMKNSPALESGLLAGDLIYSVKTDDGVKRVAELGYNGTLGVFLGDEGTSVEFTVLRKNSDGEYEEKSFTAVRKRIESESVYTERLESDASVGIINILEFNYKTPVQFESAIEELKKAGCDKFVMDLRGNLGGIEISIGAILSFFLNEGDVYIQTKDREGNVEQKTIKPVEYEEEALKGCNVVKEKIGIYKDLKMVVLCDYNTASAAELFVANFKDYGIAKTVGATTRGKGCLQHTYGLNGGFSGAVKLTTHMYYSGGDKDLVGYDKVGIEPDVSVELGEEQTKVSINIVPHSEDAQLMAAVELFK